MGKMRSISILVSRGSDSQRVRAGVGVVAFGRFSRGLWIEGRHFGGDKLKRMIFKVSGREVNRKEGYVSCKRKIAWVWTGGREQH